MKIAMNIRAISTQQLADKVGISRAMISRMRNKKYSSEKIIKRYAEALEYDVDDFIMLGISQERMIKKLKQEGNDNEWMD